MSNIDERRNAFENKFALDAELRFKATARRNKLLGLWAAELLGKDDDAAQQYAQDVVKADLAEPGEEDVVRKLVADFSAGSVAVSDDDIREKMLSLLEVAIEQINSAS